MAPKADELDFAKLRAFDLVARHGTLQVAAARMNLTVSAVSTQIKRLEEVVGAELFQRTPGKLTITAEGERFAADTQQLLDMAERALMRLHEQAGHSGQVNLSLGADYAWLFMPKIDSFSARHPNIRTAIRIHRGTEAMTALQKGQVDFCIGAFLRRPRGVRFQTVATSTMSMIFRGRDAPEAGSSPGSRPAKAPQDAELYFRRNRKGDVTSGGELCELNSVYQAPSSKRTRQAP